jgi:peroxiredoxin
MKKLLIFLTLIIHLSISAQNIFFGVIDSYINKDLVLTLQKGDESIFTDRIKTKANGSFSYDFSERQIGLYRVYMDNNESFDIIFNNEPEIEIFTRTNNAMYTMIIIESDENKQLYRYTREQMIISYKIDLLKQFIEIYPDESFAGKAEKEIKKLRKQNHRNLKKSIKNNKSSFAGRYLSYFEEPSPPKRYNELQKKQYLKKNYLDNFVFTDTAMIYSDAYTNIVFDYIMIYRESEEQLYDAAVKVIEHISGTDSRIFSHIFDYILKGFESLEMYEICARLSIEYGDLCIDTNDNLQLRIRNYADLSPGKISPDFVATDIKNETIILSELNSEIIILFFWASWCEHCKAEIKKLENLFMNHSSKEIKLIGISLDYEEAELLNYLKEVNLDWTVIADYKAWDGNIIKDYAVYATPSIIILDKNRSIIGKPNNVESLENNLIQIID